MTLTKVLITVKTYPNLSTKYEELVCTAGFRKNGSWIRIYPIPFRKLDFDDRYKKYQWIEIDLEKNPSDFRSESFKPKDTMNINITALDSIGTENEWKSRRDIVLKNGYHSNLTQLIAEAKDRNKITSLVVFKPTDILDFKIEAVDREWDPKKIETIMGKRMQLNLFQKDNSEDLFQVVKKLPYEFSYVFVDNEGKQSKLMIEDWEIGQLYWNCLKRHNNDEKLALEDVRKKYWDNFAKTKDLFFFLGTTLINHYRAPNPFIIIGLFYPPHQLQQRLF